MPKIIINVPTDLIDTEHVMSMIEGWVQPYLQDELGWDDAIELDMSIEWES